MIPSSYFDDNEDDETTSSKVAGFWKTSFKHKKIKESKFQSNPDKYFKSILYKRTKKTNEFKPLTFVISGNRISYIKVIIKQYPRKT